MTEVTLIDMVIRLSIAAACGMVVGMEREVKERPAGLRTFTLISIGAASFTLIVLEVVEQFLLLKDEDMIAIDPTRIIKGVIGGIGFLGAGAIIQSQGRVVGVTTGASIWVSGAIGVACGFGLLKLAGLITAMIFLILWGLGSIERRYIK